MKRRMLYLGFSAMLALNWSTAVAQAQDDKVFRCITKDAVSILQDGTLNKEIGAVALAPFDRMVVDVSSGHVTFPNTGKRDEWIVERTSVDENDYVLYPKTSRRIGRTAANAVSNFIRLRAAASDPAPRFVAFILSYIVTGTCERLK